MEMVRKTSIFVLIIAVSRLPLIGFQGRASRPVAGVNAVTAQKATAKKNRPRHRREIVTLYRARPPVDPIPSSPPEPLFQIGMLPPELFLFSQKAPVLGPPAQK